MILLLSGDLHARAKKCAQVCKLLVPTKQIQFSKRQCRTEFLGCPCCDGIEIIVWYELPNGQKHGKEEHYNNDDLYYVEGYSNGIKLYAYNVEKPDDFS